MNENIDDLSSYGGEDHVDISLPDMPVPEVLSESTKEIEDEFDGAFKFGFIGAGQGGGRLAETFHKFGYRRVCAINTSPQDLNTLKLENKLSELLWDAPINLKYLLNFFSLVLQDLE